MSLDELHARLFAAKENQHNKLNAQREYMIDMDNLHITGKKIAQELEDADRQIKEVEGEIARELAKPVEIIEETKEDITDTTPPPSEVIKSKSFWERLLG